MVQTVIEPFNINVIKVTITDKPGLRRQSSEESLKKAFDALRQYARQERRIREVRSAIVARIAQRRLRRYFDTWHNRAVTLRKVAEYAETKMSNEKRIELLVSAIAEKQKEMTVVREEKPEVQKEAKTPLKSNNRIPTAERKRSPSAKAKGTPWTPAQSRLKAQKQIIQEQRAKLAAQNKYIEDLKLKEMDKQAKETSKQTISVAKQALNQCDQRTRRGLIHLMREEGCRDKSIVEIPRIPSPPGFLIRMEARAEARKQRMKLTEEIRQRKREEQKKREEISRREIEEQERQRQIQAMKEAKRLRKEQEERRIKEIEKNRKLEFLADQFYNRYLFRRYIIEPLNKLVEDKYMRLKRADQHYAATLLTKVVTAWKNEWIEQQKAKLQLANKLYRHNLLWYAFDDWKLYALDMRQKSQTAIDFYDMKIQTKCLKAWRLRCAKIRAIAHDQEVKAKKHYEKRLKKLCFNIWREYITIADDIREREQRRDEWRDLIKKFIPDTPKLRKASLSS